MSPQSLPQDAAELLAWFREWCFQELGVRKACVTPEADFVQDLGMNSLDAVHLVFTLEEEFDLDIPDTDADQMRTVGDAIALLQQLQQSKPAS